MEIKEELKKYQEIINNELEKQIQVNSNMEKTLYESMNYSLLAGGKRIRPILVLATYQLFKKDYKICMPYAIALEMIHNFILIHDDLPGIDNDDFRHGKLTNHKKYNEATAILTGDALFNKGYNIISEDLKNTSNLQEIHKKIKIFNEFTIAVGKMIDGEYIDTEFEGKKITNQELKYIHSHKTGELLKLPVRMGAILGDATEKELEAVTKYAENIGLAFQIKDDILSEEGDEKVLGKPVGNDKKMEKCTYVSQYGLQGAKEELEKVTKEAIKCLSIFKEKAEFLKELAIYISERNK